MQIRDGSGSGSGKLSRFRLRIRFRAKCSSGSGSGSGDAKSCIFETAPAPAAYPKKLSRLRLWLRTKCPGDSGSGQSVPVPAGPAGPATAPHPCHIAIQELFTGPLPLCALFAARPTSAVEHSSTYNRAVEHWHFLITFLHRHPGIVYRQYSLCAVFVAVQHSSEYVAVAAEHHSTYMHMVQIRTADSIRPQFST